MSGIIEQQFILNIASQLDRFRTIEPNRVYNFRCNICGDSQKNEFKARGYFFYVAADDIYMVTCHNCSSSYSFQHYLKVYFENEYKDLRTQIFKERGIRQFAPKTKKDFKVDDIFDKEYQDQLSEILNATEEHKLLVPISSLNKCHPARVYLESRNIGSNGISRLFYTDNFKEFIKSVIPHQILGDKNVPEDPRIVFKLQTMDGEIVGFNGRCINNDSTLRYSIIMLADSYPKMFGLEVIKKDSDDIIFVTEGAMDSFFLPNCIALNGGDVNALNDIIIGEKVDKDRFVIVLDNEPRSKDTISRTEKSLKSGYNTLIWGNISDKYKDINDMIINGVFDGNGVFNNRNTLKNYVLNNNYNGTKGIIKLKQWSKF